MSEPVFLLLLHLLTFALGFAVGVLYMLEREEEKR